jgi:hypothetical protein
MLAAVHPRLGVVEVQVQQHPVGLPPRGRGRGQGPGAGLDQPVGQRRPVSVVPNRSRGRSSRRAADRAARSRSSSGSVVNGYRPNARRICATVACVANSVTDFSCCGGVFAATAAA